MPTFQVHPHLRWRRSGLTFSKTFCTLVTPRSIPTKYHYHELHFTGIKMFTLCQLAQTELFMIEAIYVAQYKRVRACLSEGWDG
jgi:hypothetical protein